MVKERISATVDRETLKRLEGLLKIEKYRNKSHVIEAAIKKLSEEADE